MIFGVAISLFIVPFCCIGKCGVAKNHRAWILRGVILAQKIYAKFFAWYKIYIRFYKFANLHKFSTNAYNIHKFPQPLYKPIHKQNLNYFKPS